MKTAEKIKFYFKKLIHNDFFIFFTLILLGLLISFKDFSAPFVYGDIDGYERANWGYENYAKNKFLTLNQVGGAWLPFHANILSLSILLTKDPQFGPRAITLALNVLSIPLIFIYTKNIFSKDEKNRIIALVSSIIYLISPLRLMLAIEPLSESVSLFFILLILVLLSNKKIKPIPIIFLINVACAIRFEFWFMIPFIWLVLLTSQSKNKKIIILECALCLAFPFYWMVNNYLYRNNYFAFFFDKYGNAHKNKPEIPYYNFYLSTRGWIDKLLDQIGFTGGLITFYTFKKLLNKNSIVNEKFIFILLPFYFLLILIAQVYLGTMEWLAPRYLFSVIVGFIPLIAYGIVKIIEFLKSHQSKYFFWILVSAIFIFSLADILGVAKNVKNWQKIVTENERDQMMQLIIFFETNELTSKNTTYLKNEKWIFPMFTFLTQKHDVKIIPLTDYVNEKDNYSEYVIYNSKDSFLCKGKIDFTNKEFKVCHL